MENIEWISNFYDSFLRFANENHADLLSKFHATNIRLPQEKGQRIEIWEAKENSPEEVSKLQDIADQFLKEYLIKHP